MSSRRPFGLRITGAFGASSATATSPTGILVCKWRDRSPGHLPPALHDRLDPGARLSPARMRPVIRSKIACEELEARFNLRGRAIRAEDLFLNRSRT